MPIYTPENTPHDCKVLLDGNEVKNAFYADTDKGELSIYKTDSEGRYYIEGDEAASETLYGDVQVLGCDGQPIEPSA